MSGAESVLGVRPAQQDLGGCVRWYIWKGEAEAISKIEPAAGGGQGKAEDLDWYRKTLTKQTRILGRIQTQIVEYNETRNIDRDTEHLHASEVCKKDWCPRSSWYKIKGTRSDAKRITASLANVYEEGHGIHDKYQEWIADLGVLEGLWKCRVCKNVMYGLRPGACLHCQMSDGFIYCEVPLEDDELMLIGNADGIINDDKGRDVLELKSIGLGTLRIEVPGIYKRYMAKEMTLQQLWTEITRPFPSHLRQLNLYMRALKLRRGVFIYEFKANQQAKEFVVSYQPKLIASIVEQAKMVKAGVENDRVVPRPDWADPENRTCRACPYAATCWGVKVEDTTQAVRTPGRVILRRR